MCVAASRGGGRCRHDGGGAGGGAGALYRARGITLYDPPVSDISRLPYSLHQGEGLRLWEPQKWILRPILGLGRDRRVLAFYHTCWLFTTPGVLISGHTGIGVIFSGRKGGYL